MEKILIEYNCWVDMYGRTTDYAFNGKGNNELFDQILKKVEEKRKQLEIKEKILK